jgi:ATP-dependent RNA helicase MSS116
MVTKLVAEVLSQLKLNIREIHSRKSQSARTKVSDEFRRSKGVILVSSDVSARGVDYPDVTLVIQVGSVFTNFTENLMHIPHESYLYLQGWDSCW